jgi:predicted lipoprotein with Yx(FWY)xxD motif
MRINKYVRVVGLIAALSVGAAACSNSTTPKSTSKIVPGKGGLTIFSYKTSYGTAVGSIDGVVAYADKNETTSKIECKGSCTTTWHPWLSDGAALHAGPGVQASLLGTTKLSNGTSQITYGGHPLYLYAHPLHALQANAQGAGGVWYIVGANGKQIIS